MTAGASIVRRPGSGPLEGEVQSLSFGLALCIRDGRRKVEGGSPAEFGRISPIAAFAPSPQRRANTQRGCEPTAVDTGCDRTGTVWRIGKRDGRGAVSATSQKWRMLGFGARPTGIRRGAQRQAARRLIAFASPGAGSGGVAVATPGLRPSACRGQGGQVDAAAIERCPTTRQREAAFHPRLHAPDAPGSRNRTKGRRSGYGLFERSRQAGDRT